ncbi:transglycosylase domain-containing protein [Pseudoxanthomonas putridarboris]|uniref:Transglycosylase domain-containing protein n=1 Tax=Pseudoxanthomonas putridarboris TaxID=752605 RepID=A0ABU9J0E5_9GAMM
MGAWPKWVFAASLTLASLYALVCWGLYACGRAMLPDEGLAPTTYRAPASIRAQLTAVEFDGTQSIPRLNPFTAVPALLMAATQPSSDRERGLRILSHASRVASLRAPAIRGNLRRHLADMARAIVISRHWSSGQIGNTLLAESHFGRSARGVEQAALAYYGLPANQLRAEESLALVTLMRGPRYYDPACHRERFEARYLRAAEATEAKAPNLALDRAMERMLQTADCGTTRNRATES